MHLGSLGRLITTSVLLASIASSRKGSAEPAPTESQLNAARQLFVAAEKDEDALRWGDALEKLDRVAQVKLTSGIRYHTALCEEHLGHLVAALRDYKAAADQAHVENAADVLRLVDKRVADSGERIPRVVVVLVPTLPDAAVSLDGDPVHPGAPISVDPGVHTIEATAAGRIPVTTTFSLKERDADSIELKLEPATPPPRAPPLPSTIVPAPRAAQTPAASRESRHDRNQAFVATVATVVLAAGGVGAYAAATSEHADAIQACAEVASFRPDACDSRRNIVRTWDWVAVGAWAGAAATATWAVVSFAALARAHRHEGPTAEVLVGPASLGLRGTF